MKTSDTACLFATAASALALVLASQSWAAPDAQTRVRDGMIVMPICHPKPGETRPWLNPAYSPECRAKFVVDDLGTLQNKLDALAPIPKPGAPPMFGRPQPWLADRGLKIGGGSDGPAGVRGASSGVTAFPTPLSISASFDRQVAATYGDLIGQDFYAYGDDSMLGPAMDTARTWHFGRVTESFGEDPYLSGQTVAAEVVKIQSHHVVTTLKHFTAYNQEQGRSGDHPLGLKPAVNDDVSERALREIYLQPFRAAVAAGPNSTNVMCSFPRINGVYACQNPHTLGILKNEWGFEGSVGPDFPDAQRSIVAAVNAGLDGGVFQASGGFGPPDPSDSATQTYNGETLRDAVAKGQVSPARVDDLLMRRLVPDFAVGAFDHPAVRQGDDISTDARRAALVDVITAGTVLLKNDGGVLPLTGVHSIALIGAQAGARPQVVEMGSASVTPTHIAPILPAVTARAGEGVRVTYAPGALGLEMLPIAPASMFKTPDGAGGFKVEYFNNPNFDYSKPPVAVRLDGTVDNTTMPNIPGLAKDRQWTERWTGMFTPIASGVQKFTLQASGSARLYIGGQLVGRFDNCDFTNNIYANVPMEAGKPVEVRVEWNPRVTFGTTTMEAMASALGPVVRLGWSGPDDLIERAAAAAKAADVAVVFVSNKVGEGMDRTSLALPNDQDALIEAVAAANPRTVVVLQTGGAVTMPWISKVPAVMEMWLPGDSIGPATAKLLFGDADPGGRLPITFPLDETQGPGQKPSEYPGTLDATGAIDTAHYDEGIFVGYRYWDKYDQTPLFPFGYGLSYTTFDVKGLGVERMPHGRTVDVAVTNTGNRAGRETVEVYLGFPAAAGEPPKQLKGYEKVFLKPGEREIVHVGLNADAFRYWDDAAGGWRAASGPYQVMVGTSSRDIVFQAPTDAPE